MAVSLPNGTLWAIASGYGSSKAMSAVTNANPGVATLEASHGVVLNDVLEVTSGWSKLNGRIVRAGTPSTNDIPLTGINTSSTTLYPAGSGTGTVREITGWTQIQQVLNIESSGGEQQFLEYQFVEDDDQKRIPTSKTAQGLTLQIADDPTLPWVALASAANDDKLARAIRATLPGGAVIYYNAYVTLNDTPTMTVNNIMAVQLTLSLVSRAVRYAS